jgi:uncharacterized protein (DUF362 family)
MAQHINRRDFLAAAATLTAASLLDTVSHRLMASGDPKKDEMPDIAVVKGSNYYDATAKAVDLLGGMKRFVPRGSRVGLLVNSSFENPGTYVKPQITLALTVMCLEAGAKEIVSLEGISGGYWRRATLSEEHRNLVRTIRDPGEHVYAQIKGGKLLKEIEIARDYLECDVLINVPVFKDHEGTHFTGSLKNIMGATSGATNRHFHLGSGAPGYYADPGFLSQCIAEANLVRKPTLCVGDGTDVLSTNGPFGPGKTIHPQTVVAGTDPVAVDAFGSMLLDLNPDSIVKIRRAAELGVGSMDIGMKKIVRATV